MGPWNVTGLAADEVDVFITQPSDHYDWDFVCLQETEDIEFESGHVMCTCGSRSGGLRIPAMLVRERWVSALRLAASGGRWLAIDVPAELVCYYLLFCFIAT